MNAPLRIALAYFSIVPLQRWLNRIFGTLLVIALITGAFQGRAGRGGAYVLALLSAVLMALAPAVAGGAALRTTSSPVVLHLLPHGRIRMVLGATLAITLLALLLTLPVLMVQLTGGSIPGAVAGFSAPTVGHFLFLWGFIALLWVVMFIVSRNQSLFLLSFILLIAIIRTIAEVVAQLPVTADQVAMGQFALGAAVWIAFALWYLGVGSVVRPDWMSGWASGQSATPWTDMGTRRWFGRADRNVAPVSRSRAMHQYLVGIDSSWTPLWVGGLYAVVLLATFPFLPNIHRERLPVFYLMHLTLFSALALAPIIVRRTRLLWLRAGLDRASLFATAERHVLGVQLAVFCIPLVLFVGHSVMRQPDRTTAVLLYAGTQCVAALGFQYAGLTVTRRWKAGAIILFVVLGLLYVVASGLLTVTVQQGAPDWAHVVALCVFGTLAVALRAHARRAWRTLDWRVAGSPLPQFGRSRA